MTSQTSESSAPPRKDDLLHDVLDTRAYDAKVKKAQNALYAITILQMALEAIRLFLAKNDMWVTELVINLGVGFVFLGLAMWCKYKPLAAITTALVLYGGLFITGAIVDPATLYKGIIFKAVVVIYLVNGFIAARQAQQIKNLG